MNHVDPQLIKGLAIGLGAIGPAIGVGLIGSAAVGAIGRTPRCKAVFYQPPSLWPDWLTPF